MRKYAIAVARVVALAGGGAGVSVAGVGFSRGVGASGRGGSRRSREARNAPGRSMWFGHDQPVSCMSALSAAKIWGAVQAVRSRPDRIKASQIWPGCTALSPMLPAITAAASCCSLSGRGAWRRWLFGFEEFFDGGRVRTLGDLFPT